MWQQAASGAGTVDAIFFTLLVISAFFAGAIAILLVFFAIRYRKGAAVDRTVTKQEFLKLEVAWTLIPLGISMVIFVWASKAYYDSRTPPEDAMELYVTGRQWMWKIQHPEGNREINELHLPAGKPVKLTMATEDVIHSFYIPAFRVKQDVLPGRYTTEWFIPNKVGQYHLFCAEYCGTLHSGMIGTVYVMEPADYQQWLSGALQNGSMQSAGDRLFHQFGCVNCHVDRAGTDAPALAGIWNSRVKMQSGETVLADANYIRESILDPQKKIVAGFNRFLMPNFSTQVTAEQLSELVEYVKSLTPGDSSAARSAK